MKDNWNAALYDGKHAFVSLFGQDLVGLLDPKKEEEILDLGCGTGDLANELYEQGVEVIGVDKSQNMVNQAKAKYPHLSFFATDVLALAYEKKFDAVFSNATLHWVKSPKEALIRIYQSLKHGGRFVAEFGGKGNVEIISNEIIDQIKKEGISYTSEDFPWYFPSIGEYTSLMEEVGFRVTFAQHFERPTRLEGDNGLRNWVNMFAGSLLESVADESKERIISNVEGNLRDSLFKDGEWHADYKRIRVIGIKD